MIFQISINGKPYCEAEAISVVTMVSERTRRERRISLHAGGDGGVQWLAANLGAGDEIVVRIVDAARLESSDSPGCSFCGRESRDVSGLVKGPAAAICGGCVTDFSGAMTHGHELPAEASIRSEPEWACGFCGKQPGTVPGVVVRNGAAVCPECLRACSDILSEDAAGQDRIE